MHKTISSRIHLDGTRALLASSALLAVLATPAMAGEGGEPRPGTELAEKDFFALMAQGKLEADLGNYDAASMAFAAVAHDETAPAALRWEALVREGLVLGAAGETGKSREAFNAVREDYSEEPAAMRFLIHAVMGNAVGKVWLDFKPEFEELLRSAQVVSSEEIGMGADQPKVLYLARDGVELKAIWKPTQSQSPSPATYRSEVAAYELDKILELDMVPPTVEREINGRPGALQLWVHGCKIYRDVESRSPEASEWNRELSRLKTFDLLIGNRDRNASNILVDPAWGIVLIDHSLAFSSGEDIEDPPLRFDRGLTEKLGGLSKIGLQVRLEGILTDKDIEDLLKRRDRLLAVVEQLIAEKGEASVFF